MKRADIKLRTETYAVKIGGRVVKGWAVATAPAEAKGAGTFAVSTDPADLSPMRIHSKAWAHSRAFLSTWAEYVVERDHTEAIREDINREASLRYERKERAKRERFKKIVPAFEQLPCDRERHYGQVDLATLITDIMVDGGSTTVTLSEFDLQSIADCITELRAVVAQSALTADDLPQAGWGVPLDPHNIGTATRTPSEVEA